VGSGDSERLFCYAWLLMLFWLLHRFCFAFAFFHPSSLIPHPSPHVSSPTLHYPSPIPTHPSPPTGHNPSAPADIIGNSLLHLAARHGTSATVDTIVTLSPALCVYEQENYLGRTCLEEGADAGNFGTARRLVKFGAVARCGLGLTRGVVCWGWLMALARKQERARWVAVDCGPCVA
jgi:hypothetical protein